MDENIYNNTNSIKHLLRNIENKCEQLNSQAEELFEIKNVVAQKLKELHQLECEVTQLERNTSFLRLKQRKLENSELQNAYEQLILAKIKNNEFLNQKTQTQLQVQELKLKQKHLEKQKQFQQAVQEELKQLNCSLQNKLQQKVKFLSEIGKLQLANNKIRSITSSKSVSHFKYVCQQDQYLFNQISLLDVYYQDYQIPFNVKIGDFISRENLRDDHSMCSQIYCEKQVQEKQSDSEVIFEQSEKFLQRTLKEEFEDSIFEENDLQDSNDDFCLISSLLF